MQPCASRSGARGSKRQLEQLTNILPPAERGAQALFSIIFKSPALAGPRPSVSPWLCFLMKILVPPAQGKNKKPPSAALCQQHLTGMRVVKGSKGHRARGTQSVPTLSQENLSQVMRMAPVDFLEPFPALLSHFPAFCSVSRPWTTDPGALPEQKLPGWMWHRAPGTRDKEL